MNYYKIIDRDLESKMGDQEPTLLSGLPNWYAIYVKSRHEFMVQNELRKKGVETFLPPIKKISQWKDRKKLVEYPLFPGYVFVRVMHHPGAFLSILKSRGVVTFVSLEPGVPTPIIADEIASLRLLVECGVELDVFPGLRQGAKVRIKSGPLRDAEGILSKKENEYIFHVNVYLLGRNVSVKINPHDIERV